MNDELVKRQLLSFRAESKNYVIARFVVSFDYAQDDSFNFYDFLRDNQF